MARFVDADKLSEQITTEYCGKCGVYNGELCCSCPMNDALNYIETFPTVDVAPRAEVAREIFEVLDEKIYQYIPDLYTLEICKDLKKKYTEGGDQTDDKG